jgi:L-alanine-DL-glutamate epimerase-like enolase superfamily enzyme
MGTLAGHTLARIEWLPCRRRYPREIGWNAQGGPHGREHDVVACRLTTDQGATGWGFCGPRSAAAERLIGRRVEDLIDPAVGAADEALALDIPLHDLAGRILGQPVWRLLGAHGGAEIPVYDASIYFDDLAPGGGAEPGIAALLDACGGGAALGHAHFKLKIGRGLKYMPRAEGDRRDIEVTRAVRREFPRARLLVDGNDGYDPEGICRYVDAVADCALYWVEEPFLEQEAGLHRLRERLAAASPRTLIADGESRNGRLQEPPGRFGKWQEDHLEELLALAGQRLIDVLLMDVGAMGFTAWRRVLPRLRALGVGGSPHAWSEPFKTCYAAQLGCGLGGVPIVEGVPGIVDGVDDSAYRLRDGVLAMPESPGFGLELRG